MLFMHFLFIGNLLFEFLMNAVCILNEIYFNVFFIYLRGNIVFNFIVITCLSNKLFLE